ncbi:hypothetical protein G6N76_09575 [Rhizobium daejeonense]|uniref:Uncharacterized protein n=1 Tax=Rhizobium daejeonense TaxID=240521 RepID=A0A6M1RYI1_9HYPH|nr:hypothetical protein [Rhizobium daejeonense]NGO63925.1 hypothetical protein [Rhizobium daejeonense]
MTKSPWTITGTPLDYVPIDAPIIHTTADIPERPSRLWGYIYAFGAFAVGILIGAIFA